MQNSKKFFSLILGLVAVVIFPASFGDEERGSSEYVIYSSDEFLSVSKKLHGFFDHFTSILKSVPQYRMYLNDIELSVSPEGSEFAYSYKSRDGARYHVVMSSGVFRVALNASLAAKIDARNFNSGIFNCLNDFVAYNRKADFRNNFPNRLSPRIDYFMLEKCPMHSRIFVDKVESDFKEYGNFQKEFLINLYFLMLHEIGHIVLGHFSKLPENAELDADNFALVMLLQMYDFDHRTIWRSVLSLLAMRRDLGIGRGRDQFQQPPTDMRSVYILINTLKAAASRKDPDLEMRIEKDADRMVCEQINIIGTNIEEIKRKCQLYMPIGLPEIVPVLREK